MLDVGLRFLHRLLFRADWCLKFLAMEEQARLRRSTELLRLAMVNTNQSRQALLLTEPTWIPILSTLQQFLLQHFLMW